MAIGTNGETSWGIQPEDIDASNLAGAFWEDRSNYLKSVNDQLRYQVQWFNGNNLTEEVEPSKDNWTNPASATDGNGDVVNVVFKVYTTTTWGNFPSAWDLIGTIKKSRDMINAQRIGFGGGTINYSPAGGHRFTIDVSQLVADELSYSLCPINKGTWQDNKFGGMNGGLTMQDNVLNGTSAMGNPISKYNVSKNGTFRYLRIEACFEVINGDGEIVTAENSIESNIITVINSVNQFEKDSLFYAKYAMAVSSTTKYSFLSRCPNANVDFKFYKPIRMDEQAEYLQFYIRRIYSTDIGPSGYPNNVGTVGLKVETFLSDDSAENSFYLRDFEDNIDTRIDGGYVQPNDYQRQMFVQNISPYYINNTTNLIGLAKVAASNSPSNYPYWSAYTGNKITSNTAYYRVSISRFSMWYDSSTSSFNERRTSNYKYYTIDREDEKNPYPFVRFHWLNSLGGIDSYTAKRDVVEGLSISRDVIERKSGDRTWYQNNQNQGTTITLNSLYHSDTMRGGDIYKGGREVTNINAERLQSVYTEPLDKDVAKWLEEMMLSPNVWIEMETDATERGRYFNSYLRPSHKEYIPVIITNSDIETVNQAEGLVKFNIEYTLAHKVITQRN